MKNTWNFAKAPRLTKYFYNQNFLLLFKLKNNKYNDLLNLQRFKSTHLLYDPLCTIDFCSKQLTNENDLKCFAIFWTICFSIIWCLVNLSLTNVKIFTLTIILIFRSPHQISLLFSTKHNYLFISISFTINI